jgi:hypothetical protein
MVGSLKEQKVCASLVHCLLMEEQNFSEGYFLTVAEQYAVEDEKFILSTVTSEAVHEAIHHCALLKLNSTVRIFTLLEFWQKCIIQDGDFVQK